MSIARITSRIGGKSITTLAVWHLVCVYMVSSHELWDRLGWPCRSQHVRRTRGRTNQLAVSGFLSALHSLTETLEADRR